MTAPGDRDTPTTFQEVRAATKRYQKRLREADERERKLKAGLRLLAQDVFRRDA